MQLTFNLNKQQSLSVEHAVSKATFKVSFYFPYGVWLPFEEGHSPYVAIQKGNIALFCLQTPVGSLNNALEG